MDRSFNHFSLFYFRLLLLQLDAFSNKIGRSFQKLGYKKGDVVSLISYNSIEYVGIWLGLAKVGVITALINTNLRLQPLAHCIKAAKSKGVIFTGDFNASK